MEKKIINNLQDLISYWGFPDDKVNILPKRVYKGTDCGAWIALLGTDNKWYSKDDGNIEEVKEIKGFKIGTIVEGSDYGVEGKEFILPINEEELNNWIEEMENEAEEIFLSIGIDDSEENERWEPIK